LLLKSSLKSWKTKSNYESERSFQHDPNIFIPEMQGWFNLCRSFNVIQSINRTTDKTHMIISIDATKAFNKIQHHFMINVLMILGLEGMYLHIIKAIHENLLPTLYLMRKS
jgi:hypothetical protein